MTRSLSRILSVLTALVVTTVPFAAMAAEGDESGLASALGLIAFSASVAIGLVALGGALAQGRAAAAALEGIARNPSASGKIFTPLIIGLALIESLVIYALVIAFMLQGYIGSILDNVFFH
jgi:F-type H+-transporting ATPase subunit c